MNRIGNAGMVCPFKFIAILLWLISVVQYGDAENEINLKVAEMTSVGSVLAKIPQELKWPSTERRTYSILTGDTYTQVGNRNGILKVKKQMDREELCPDNRQHCYVDVTVAVLGSTQVKIVKIQIDVTDINDNEPRFENPIIKKKMSEAVAVSTSIRLDSAVDPDYGENSIQDYQLVSKTGPRSTDKYFELETITNIDGTKIPKLKLKKQLDRERIGVHELMLEAYDGGRPARTGTATVLINITDSNDNAPEFVKEVYVVEVNEHEKEGTAIEKVEAKDKDVGPNGEVVYQFPSVVGAEDKEIFDLDSNTGVISIKNSEKLDFELRRIHHLTVEARDNGPNAVPVYTTVTVKVLDVNDNKPQIEVSFVPSKSVMRASEDSGYDAIIMEDIEVGKLIAFVTVSDKDGGKNGTVDCEIPKGGIFILERMGEDSGQFLLKINSALDREVESVYDLTIEAWDIGNPPQTNATKVKFKVGDINDNAPKFFYPETEAKVLETASRGDVIADNVKATDADESPGPNSNITYSFLRGSDFIEKNGQKYALTKIFKINPVTGDVRLAMGNILDAESVRSPGYLTVLAKDNGTPPLNATTKLKISVIDENDNWPIFDQELYVFHIDEHSSDGKYIGQVRATDKDWSENTNGKITYTIEKYKSDDNFIKPKDANLWLEMFQVEEKTGFIHFYGNRTKLDREVYSDPPITISVVATDNGSPRHRAAATVKIFLSDINDNKPLVLFPDGRRDIAFIQVVPAISDSEPRDEMPVTAPQALRSDGTQTWASVVVVHEELNVSKTDSTAPVSLAQVQATDMDEGQNAELSYAIRDGDDNRYFQIDTKDGNLSFADDVDFRSIHLGCHVLKILVSDLGIPQLQSDAYVNLYLSRKRADEVNVTTAMRECKRNPLFPKIVEPTVGMAGLDGLALYIVIGFAVLIFIILFIIVMVLIIKCHCCDGRKKSRSYNCQQAKTWTSNSSGYDGDSNGKKIRKRGSSRRSYNGQGTVDSRSSFHSEWTASQTRIPLDKAEKVRVLPDQPSLGSNESRGIHDSGTGDSVSGEAYHPNNYIGEQDGQHFIPNLDNQYPLPHNNMPMQYSSQMVEIPPQQMVPYVDHPDMYGRSMISTKCTEECLQYGHGDHCWMPDSLLRAQGHGPIDMMPGGNPDRVLYQNHPGELRYHGDPSTPYYYDPGQKFSHLSSNDGSDHLGYSKGHPDDMLPSHPSFQHQPIHAPSPHPHQMRYGSDAERERAYMNLQGYESGQNQPEEMHSNLSSASSSTNPYGAALPQNSQRYRPDPNTMGHPPMYYPNPNNSRYDMMSPSQGYIPGMHEPGPSMIYNEDYSASNLLLPMSNGPVDYGHHWDHNMAIPSEHQPLINRPEFVNRSGRTSNPILDEQERLKNHSPEYTKPSSGNPADPQAQNIPKDDKLSTIQEQDNDPVHSEADGLLL